MGTDERHQAAAAGSSETGWGGICRIDGVATFILMAYSLATMVQLVVLGGQPTTAAAAFSLLQDNRVLGLLRLDLPTVLALPLYYFVLLGLFVALRRSDTAYATLSTSLAFVGVTLALATPTALSMLSLSEKYAAATKEPVRVQLLAAGEAVLATDIWHGTGAIIGGLLLQSGAVLISVVMLRSKVFAKTVGYVGIVAHGLDLAHGLLGPLVPGVSFVLMAIAGPLYLIWFPLVGGRLLQLGQRGASPAVLEG
jgi:hypothetical protein